MKLFFNIFMLLFNGFYLYKVENDLLYFKKIKKKSNKIGILGLSRIRNEELIIKDTLEHMNVHCDGYIIFDDKSVDHTIKEIISNKNIIEIILNTKWNKNRVYEETNHRDILLSCGRKYKSDWFFYFDADERFVGNIKKELEKVSPTIDSIKIRLYDAYITNNDFKDYKKHDKLLNFRKKFGPEYRDILMIWRNVDYIKYKGLDSREPVGNKESLIMFKCQHYGKAISIEQWEQTCDYYVKFFPEPYKTKWENRRGKAVHSVSDFNNSLYFWNEDLFENEMNLLEI